MTLGTALPEKEEAKREDDAQAYDGGCDADAGFCAGAEGIGGGGGGGGRWWSTGC